jgi:hypothetical protein
MMSQPTFDIQPMMNEVEQVIQKGLNNLLKNYIERYNMLENTHQQLLQLPSILHELNGRKSNSPCVSQSYPVEVCNTNRLEDRLSKVEDNISLIIPTLEKLLDKFIILNDKFKKSKHTDTVSINDVTKSSVVTTSENENIELHIVEPAAHIVKEEEEEVIDLVVEEEEEELVKEDEAKEEEFEEEVVKELVKEEEVEEEEEKEEVDEVEEEEEEEIKEKEEEVEEEEVEEEEEEEEVEEEVGEEELVKEVVEEEEEEEVEVEEDASVETESKEEEVEEEASVETESKPIEEEEEEDIFEIDIDDKAYCTNNDDSGFIWELTDDGEQGEKVGYFKEGEPFFYADEN